MRKVALWLSLAFVFTIPWETVVEYPALGSASRVVGFALAASWLVMILLKRRMRTPDSFHVALCVFVAFNAASVFWSANADRTALHALTWLQLLLVSLIFWDLYTERAHVITALQAYIFGTYAVIGDMLVNYYSGETFYYERFSAAGTSPDDLGVVLALGVPVAAYLAGFRPRDRWTVLLKVVNCTYILAAFVGIALSGTRTAMIAVMPGAVFALAVLLRLRPSTRIAVGVLFLAAATVVIGTIPDASLTRLGTTGAEITGGDLNGRLRLWTEGLAAFEQHPLRGVGGNMFRWVNSERKVAHNTFISVLVELGAIGFLLFLAIVVIAAIHIIEQPLWERWFWVSVSLAWTSGAFMLTWEYRKPTWLFLNLIVARAAATRPLRADSPFSR